MRLTQARFPGASTHGREADERSGVGALRFTTHSTGSRSLRRFRPQYSSR